MPSAHYSASRPQVSLALRPPEHKEVSAQSQGTGRETGGLKRLPATGAPAVGPGRAGPLSSDLLLWLSPHHQKLARSVTSGKNAEDPEDRTTMGSLQFQVQLELPEWTRGAVSIPAQM